MRPTPSTTSTGGTRSPCPASTASPCVAARSSRTSASISPASAPDLGVVIEVAGAVYGPSSVIRDSHRPIWDYTFPSRSPGSWATRSPIRIIDYDWSASEVYVLNSRQGDPLAMRILSGTVKSSKGGQTSLVFASDFVVPTLSRPD